MDGKEHSGADAAAPSPTAKDADDILTTILEGSPIGAAILDPATGERLFVNSALIRMFGATSRHQMLDGDISETWVNAAQLEQAFAVFSSGGTLVNLEAERRRMDGSTWWVLMNTQPVRFSGKDAGIVWHVDISDRKAAEQQVISASIEAERASRAKSEFLAHVSHELRTPLNSILGFSQILMSPDALGGLGGGGAEYARYIHSSGKHLLTLINDILDISKIEAGEFHLEESRFNVNEALGDAYEMLLGFAETHAVDLSFEPGPPEMMLVADERAVKQIVVNLLSNGIKFNSAQGRVALASSRTDDGGLMVSVTDNGVGIAEKDIPRILEPFGQVRTGAHSSHEGTGLGLSLSKHLMELHGGTLVVESTLGLGTQVCVTFRADRVSG